MNPKTGTLFYSGEAILGLVSLYELDNSEEWLVAAGKALSYLAQSRATARSLPFDRWALVATATFLPYYDIVPPPASHAQLIEHATRISERFLHQQVTSDDPAFDGAFDPTGSTNLASTGLEALLAALEFLPDDGTGLRQRIEIATQRGVAFLLHAQIKSGPFAGGMPGAVRKAGSAAKPNTLATEVRIDYVQYALTVWLRYQALGLQ